MPEEDEALLALVESRLANDDAVTYSFEGVLAAEGLTLADIDAMDDVEIE